MKWPCGAAREVRRRTQARCHLAARGKCPVLNGYAQERRYVLKNRKAKKIHIKENDL